MPMPGAVEPRPLPSLESRCSVPEEAQEAWRDALEVCGEEGEWCKGTHQAFAQSMVVDNQGNLKTDVDPADVKEAIELYERGAELMPDSFETYSKLGRLISAYGAGTGTLNTAGGVAAGVPKSDKAAKYLVDEAGTQLAVLVVGDALLEPFWPEGLGINRGFLSALDAVWLLTHFHSDGHTHDVRLALSKRAELLEKLRQLSAFTKETLLKPDYQGFELLPSSRYKLFSEGPTEVAAGAV